MPDEKKRKPRTGIGDEIAGGVTALRNPGYAAHVREARAMGEEPLTLEEWKVQQRRNRE